jgi:hypothetical protein
VLRAPTVTDELRNNVRFAPGWKVGKKLRSLTDAERDMVVAATVEHIRLCNWKVARGRRRVGLRSWGGGQVANKKAPPRRGPIQTTERAPVPSKTGALLGLLSNAKLLNYSSGERRLRRQFGRSKDGSRVRRPN